jgi:4-amino-4-deoxy-L-arabinose transferase-like glycosyltransferase
VQLSQREIFIIVFIATAIVYIFGMQVEVMEVDAAQYASISMEMLDTGSFLQVMERGHDYLDKPPLLFWLSTFSYFIFGMSSWSYKLPSVIFALIGIYSTYRFALLYYSKQTALLASAVFATCQALFLITNDVRTDTILCCSVILASWHLASYMISGKKLNFVMAFVGISLALLTKGPIGLFSIIFAFGTHILITRDWKQIWRWEWILGLVIIAIMLTPMCIGLYQQYGTKGLRFYFWTQSFGRITGENTWANNPDPFFLFHSFLWSFLPWPFFFLLAMGWNIKTLWKQKFKLNTGQEAITTGGIILSYLALSRSAYQLPHYIYVILPFASVVTANYIINVFDTYKNSVFFKSVTVIQLVLVLALWIIGFILTFIVFKAESWQWALFVYFVVSTLVVIWKVPGTEKLIYASLITIIGVNFFMSSHIYPNILKYQSQSEAGKYISAHKIPSSQMAFYGDFGFSLDFYSGYRIKELVKEKELIDYAGSKDKYCYTNHFGIGSLAARGIKCDTVLKLKDYHVTLLTLPFLNPATRESRLKENYLIKFSDN